ncbi:MAG: hypothetical protein FWH22_10370 [Fibromonadales bacterium]|nr:hypothetical protein [Fibromonadales bacterium]
MKNRFSKILPILLILGILVQTINARCNDMTLKLQLPDGWPSTFYIFEGGGLNIWNSFTYSPGSDGFHTINMGSLSGPNANPWIITQGNTWTTTFIHQNGVRTGHIDIDATSFSCAAGTYYLSFETGSMYYSTEPLYAKHFYFLPPSKKNWIEGITYILSLSNNEIQRYRMSMDPNRCGWYKVTYTEEPPTSMLIGLGFILEETIGENDGIINLAEKFNSLLDGNPGSIYFTADDDTWHAEDPGTSGVCSYNFAAIIYDTDGSVNSSFLQVSTTEGTGIRKGIPKNTLQKDPLTGVPKMVFK